MSQYWTLDTAEKRRNFDEYVTGCLLAGKPVTVKFEDPQSHVTQKQFSAMHVWCDQVAEQLNNAGLDMRVVIKNEISLDWDKDSVKRLLYKPVLEAMTGKTSTTQQDTIEPSKVAETIARHIAEKHSCVLPFWPSREHSE